MTDLMQPNQRQSGAAQVPVLIFLFLFVLFLGAGFFAYSKADENSKLRREIADLEAENEYTVARKQILDEYNDGLIKVLGKSFTGTFTGDNDVSYYGDASQENLDLEKFQIQNAALAAKVQESIDTFVSSEELDGIDYSGSLTMLFENVRKKIESLESQVKTAEEAQAAEVQRLATARQDLSKAETTFKDENQSQRTTYNNDRDNLEGQLEQQKTLLNAANQSYRDIRTQMTNLVSEHQQQIAAMQTQLETMQGRVDAMSQRISMINPPESADGIVLSSSETARRAWINLGQKDMLPVGTTFTIVDPIDGRVKGEGTVLSVEWSRAELAITKVVDRYDPVRPDDQVRNDLYSPNLRRNIYLMGRFVPPFTRPVVKQQLEALGNTVVEELSPAVDLVLVGKGTINEDGSGFTPLTETDEFKFASFLRLEMRPVTKMRQFLTAPSER